MLVELTSLSIEVVACPHVVEGVLNCVDLRKELRSNSMFMRERNMVEQSVPAEPEERPCRTKRDVLGGKCSDLPEIGISHHRPCSMKALVACADNLLAYNRERHLA